MKILLALLFGTLTYAQVGINTTTPDPNTALDVNGDVKLHAKYSPTTDKVLVWQNDSIVGWRNFPTGDGLIDGLINNTQWRGQPLNVSPGTVASYLDNDIDLDMAITFTLAPRTLLILDIEFSVPIGVVAPIPTSLDAIVGVRLQKDGVDLPREAAGFSLKQDNFAQAQGFYNDWVYNPSYTDDLTVTYEWRGYLKQLSANSAVTQYRFRQYNAAAENNWGTEKVNFAIMVVGLD